MHREVGLRCSHLVWGPHDMAILALECCSSSNGLWLHCRTLLAREHKRIRAEYEERVKQLEQERQGVEEERVQVRTNATSSSMHCAAVDSLDLTCSCALTLRVKLLSKGLLG